ncbi:hypothetical protein SNE25_04735 [Mucilaginibacter sabulilitoris]|uniref:Methylamine utilisation protein MauE domain-containing protein n=1 Tax=Mucilaginibacter sabulilitoris TaxID=1173583 RepID=A0ABZ0TPK1_9SPHI|nr:MauE/DoxX family redox-associated membrane protein [Mucilaginibacter sabulilitoris]WPU94827.1 hypothetical protein SNE25_04735 [Mucilaginibacter sabulilitoris]
MESVIKSHRRIQISEQVRERLAIAISWLSMALFLYTAYAKTVDHDRFLNGLLKVQFIRYMAVPISYAVPSIELIVAYLLLLPQTSKYGLYSFIAVMAAFTAYIASAMIWENTLPCHCGGAIEKLSWSQHLWFNLAFIVLAIIALRLVKLNTSLKN